MIFPDINRLTAEEWDRQWEVELSREWDGKKPSDYRRDCAELKEYDRLQEAQNRHQLFAQSRDLCR